MEFAWRPGIGDPTFTGWLTVVFYLLAAGSSYATARLVSGTPPGPYGREIVVWHALAVLFLLLGINKQLDLQSALTEIGRLLAHHQGWYDRRDVVQLAFVGGVALVSALAGLGGMVLLRGVSLPTWIALLGAMIVLIFVVIRAASFHHVDVFIGSSFASIRWNAILEIGGLIVVLTGAWLRMLALRKR